VPELSSPLSILMVLDYHLPYVSGLSVTVDRLGEGLAARGHSVSVLTHRHDPALPREETRGGARGVRVIRAPVLMRVGKAQVSPAIVLAARREIPKADVLHLHAPLVPAVPLAFLARRFHTPTVTTFHCDLRLPPGAVNRAVESIARFSQDYALERSDVIVNSTEDYACSVPLLARRMDRFVGIVPPMPQLPPSGVSPEELRARWGVGAGPVVLFVGRFAEEKGLPLLVAAREKLSREIPGVVLVLAGENRNIPGEDVGRRLAPLLADPSSGVVATGHVRDEEMAALFAMADVLALPSVNSTESFGMIQVEAMKAGLPVVASDLPGVREPIRRTGMGELSSTGDADSLAEALAKVLRSPAEYRSRADAAREAFSVERTLDAYEGAYRRAIASSASSASRSGRKP
jgi:glycosyltransferase involved in cell wall biosynthesis